LIQAEDPTGNEGAIGWMVDQTGEQLLPTAVCNCV
jgi:hypothetical protein